MKKMILSIMTMGAMFFATQNLQAQEEEEIEEVEVDLEVEYDEYSSIDVNELPQTVKDAILTDYNGAVVSEAWMKAQDDKKIYKLKLDVRGEMMKVYIDEDGKWLEKDDEDNEEK